jgi:pectinesterase
MVGRGGREAGGGGGSDAGRGGQAPGQSGASGNGTGGGSAGSGGIASTAGQPGTAGAGTAGASSGACLSPVASSANRPQLTSAEAADYTIAKYLASAGPFSSLTTDNWDPTPGLGDASAFSADFTVAADGSGTHTTLQAAFNAVSGSARRYILVKAGTYRGQVSYTGSTPVTLYAANSDATKVVIVNNKSQQDGDAETLGVKSAGFQLMNLTLSNDFPTPASGSNLQALALKTTGDKVVLENVRMHGFQDTVQFAATNATTVSRVYVKNSFIEGDTDYIYGSATVVLDGVTVHYLSSRRGSGSGITMAPSTSVANERGFLFIHCTFTADDAAPDNRIYLGRSWDTSSTTPTPNGQGVIRDSVLGAHVDRDSPWTAAATSGRAYSADGNRFYEYCNSGPGASP